MSCMTFKNCKKCFAINQDSVLKSPMQAIDIDIVGIVC